MYYSLPLQWNIEASKKDVDYLSAHVMNICARQDTILVKSLEKRTYKDLFIVDSAKNRKNRIFYDIESKGG